MKIYTSRFSNKDLAKADAHIVGVTLYPPKFPTAAKIEGNIPQFAPMRRYFNITDREVFRRLYREQLDRLGKEGVWKLISPYDDGKDIVFLCYEDVTCDNPEKNWCHRRLLAEWIEENFGFKVDEYPDSGNWESKHPKSDLSEQISMF